ncbi:MAG: hypothetical protein HRT58_03500 [Crocinitomicaceae bacterium]|nr:hypothetical protein [Flavobacteriales bacterium]NQZ34698.1 hypothetical protein [Crocinitomicaceae bacterium]PHR35588.1 MAG: hypothetical protein COA38_01685 [Fluviicola sp.]
MTKSFLIKSTGFAAIIFGMFALTSCGEENPSLVSQDLAVNDDYYEFQDFIMTDHEIPGVISLPDETANIGASTRPEVKHEESFKWEISVGQKFQLLIEDFGILDDLVGEKKKDLKDQKFFKIKYLIDESDLIVYERTLMVAGSKYAAPEVGIEHKSYHVYGQKTIENIIYGLSSAEEGCDKHIVELMAKSIKSFKRFNRKS